MDSVIVTHHGVKRTKERLGISKKIADKNAQKAFEFGLHHNETKAGLKRYIDSLFIGRENHANNVRIYNRHVYLFSNQILITVMPLPNKFNTLADKLQKEKTARIQAESSSDS